MFSRIANKAASAAIKPAARAYSAAAAEATAPRGPIVVHSVAPRTWGWLETGAGVYAGVWGCYMYSLYADHKVSLSTLVTDVLSREKVADLVAR
jgi:hypothetical protein